MDKISAQRGYRNVERNANYGGKSEVDTVSIIKFYDHCEISAHVCNRQESGTIGFDLGEGARLKESFSEFGQAFARPARHSRYHWSWFD